MTQQIINVGANPNDGTGWPLRTAFQICNANFSDLYGGDIGAAGGDLSGNYPNPAVAKINGQPISLGGSFTTSGAHTLTFTVVGNSTVTLPTSGILRSVLTGSFTLNTSATSTIVAVSGMLSTSTFKWWPQTADAAAINPFLYLPPANLVTGSATLVHPSNPAADLTFTYEVTI